MALRALRNFFAFERPSVHFVPDGIRIYAVGDIHGRLDLLDDLLEQIRRDDRDHGAARTQIIFLGDLIDRGPDSRSVVERLLKMRSEDNRLRFLIGNHEEVFLRALEGDLRSLRFLVRIGGRETLISYGITEEEYRRLDYEDLAEALRERVPAEHVAFLSAFERWVEIGDYLFVHAGIRPGIGLQDQAQSDLCWIRDDFLKHRESFGKMIVHGHSITNDVDIQSNRIGIDTGAFASGRLTAIGLQGNERWFLST